MWLKEENLDAFLVVSVPCCDAVRIPIRWSPILKAVSVFRPNGTVPVGVVEPWILGEAVSGGGWCFLILTISPLSSCVQNFSAGITTNLHLLNPNLFSIPFEFSISNNQFFVDPLQGTLLGGQELNVELSLLRYVALEAHDLGEEGENGEDGQDIPQFLVFSSIISLVTKMDFISTSSLEVTGTLLDVCGSRAG